VKRRGKQRSCFRGKKRKFEKDFYVWEPPRRLFLRSGKRKRGAYNQRKRGEDVGFFLSRGGVFVRGLLTEWERVKEGKKKSKEEETLYPVRSGKKRGIIRGGRKGPTMATRWERGGLLLGSRRAEKERLL